MGWGTSGHALIYSVFVAYLLWSHVYFSSIKSKNNLTYPNLPRSCWSDTIYPELHRWIMQDNADNKWREGDFCFPVIASGMSLEQQIKGKRFLWWPFQIPQWVFCENLLSNMFFFFPVLPTFWDSLPSEKSHVCRVTRLTDYTSMSIQ